MSVCQQVITFWKCFLCIPEVGTSSDLRNTSIREGLTAGVRRGTRYSREDLSRLRVRTRKATGVGPYCTWPLYEAQPTVCRETGSPVAATGLRDSSWRPDPAGSAITITCKAVLPIEQRTWASAWRKGRQGFTLSKKRAGTSSVVPCGTQSHCSLVCLSPCDEF